MRKIILIFFISAFPILAFCQTGKLNLGIFTQGGGFNKEFTPYEVGFVLDYEVLKRFSVGIQAEHNISLFKENNIQSYATNEVIQGRIGYSAYHSAESDLSVFLGLGCPAKCHNDWNYMFYEAGLKFKLMACHKLKPFIRLSVREYDSHTKDIKSNLRLMESLGCEVTL